MPAVGEGDAGEPFESWHFDEEFVRSAAVTEATAEERIERLRRIDADHDRLRTQQELDDHRLGPRRRRRAVAGGGGGRALSTLLIVGSALVIGIYTVKDGLFSDEGAEQCLRRRVGDVVGGETAYDLPAGRRTSRTPARHAGGGGAGRCARVPVPSPTGPPRRL